MTHDSWVMTSYPWLMSHYVSLQFFLAHICWHFLTLYPQGEGSFTILQCLNIVPDRQKPCFLLPTTSPLILKVKNSEVTRDGRRTELQKMEPNYLFVVINILISLQCDIHQVSPRLLQLTSKMLIRALIVPHSNWKQVCPLDITTASPELKFWVIIGFYY